MTKQLPPTGVRLPPALKKQLKIAAVENGRTLSAEIVHRLEQSVNPTDPLEKAALEARDILSRALKG